MTTLNPDDRYFVVINTFSVKPDNADRLVENLTDITEKYVRETAGFVSANFHISADRRQIINYAQWRSKEDATAMLANPAGEEKMKQATVLATSIDPVFCDLVWTSAPVG